MIGKEAVILATFETMSPVFVMMYRFELCSSTQVASMFGRTASHAIEISLISSKDLTENTPEPVGNM